MRLLTYFLILAIVLLHYKLWLSNDSVLHLRQSQQRLAQQQQANEKQTQRNQAMIAEIIELKQGEQALEEQARFALGMIKSGETYYQFSEEPAGDSVTASPVNHQ
ncbi:MAG: septum formation initiator family protein [Legionella sp.]|nr:septum formation initiator family protein [Legionella sp.]